MTKGLTMNFGGVKLKKSEVASTKTKTVKDYYGKAVNLFMVDFKNGVKVAYKQSSNKFGVTPSIYARNDNNVDKSITNANFVEGLELKGSKKMNDITISGGSVAGIDVANGGYDVVSVRSADNDNSGVASGTVSTKILSGGTVWTDKIDETHILNSGDKFNAPHRNDL